MPKIKKRPGINWEQNIDFAVVVLCIIIFGSAIAYVMINAVQ